MAFSLRSAPAPTPQRRPSAAAPATAALTRDDLMPWCDGLGLPETFLPYAELLQLAPELPKPVSPDEKAKDEALLNGVLEHFRANQLGPSSFPSQSLRILNLVANPDADMSELVKLVSQDPALSAAVLKVANSVMYRGVQETETVRDAINRLGLSEVARVAGMVSARTLFNPKVKAKFISFGPRWNKLFHQSATVAMTGSALALQKPGARADRVFLAGMLHDVGKSIALRSIAAIRTEKKQPPAPMTEDRIERVLEQAHLVVSEESVKSWGLPTHVLAACCRHHEEGLPTDGDFTDLHVVRVASTLHLLRTEPALNPHAGIELFESVSALKMTPHALRSADTEMKRLQANVTTLYGGNVVRG